MPYFDARCEDACSCDCVIAAAHSGAPRLKSDTTNLSWREDSKLASAPPPNISHTSLCMYVRKGPDWLSDSVEGEASIALRLCFCFFVVFWGREGGSSQELPHPQTRLRTAVSLQASWWFLEGSPDASCECENSKAFCQVCITRQETEQTVTLCVSC